ncbi:MAG: DUF1559 domain-containing protein [Planctomycetia bacterium]|nr:DUF1559 domain-containing protein [Planctomycetia bacterium]
MKKCALFCVLLGWGMGTLFAGEGAERVMKALSPWTTQGTTLVVHVDLQELRLRDTFHEGLNAIKPVFKRTLTGENEITLALKSVEQVLDAIEDRIEIVQKAGGRDLFVLVDTGDLSMPVYLVLPVTTKDEASLQAVEEIVNDFPNVPQASQAWMEQYFHAGRYNDAVVFVPSQSAIEKDLKADYIKMFFGRKEFAPNEKFAAAFAQTEGCSVELAFVMNDFIAGMIPGLLEMARQNEDFPLMIPPDNVVIRGLDRVALGVDPCTNQLKLSILSKTDKSARNLGRVYEKWQTQALAMAEEEADGDPMQTALMCDMMEVYFTLLEPTVEGNRLFWDFAAMPEKFPTLQNVSSAPAVMVAGMAMGLLLPAVQSSREAARRTLYANHFKQVALAMLNYEAMHQAYPLPYTVDSEGKPLHSWRVQLLPFIEQYAMYEKIRLDEPWDSEWNRQFHNLCPAIFKHPALDLAPEEATIGVVVGDDTVFPAPQPGKNHGVKIGAISDGMINTILLVECEAVCWMDPRGDVSYEEAKKGLVSTFPTISFAAFCDGSVHSLSSLLDFDVLDNLLRRNDGNAVNSNDYER